MKVEFLPLQVLYLLFLTHCDTLCLTIPSLICVTDLFNIIFVFHFLIEPLGLKLSLKGCLSVKCEPSYLRVLLRLQSQYEREVLF